jgi:hypothetical protein
VVGWHGSGSSVCLRRGGKEVGQVVSRVIGTSYLRNSKK